MHYYKDSWTDIERKALYICCMPAWIGMYAWMQDAFQLVLEANGFGWTSPLCGHIIYQRLSFV